MASAGKKRYREPQSGRRPFSAAIGTKIYQWSGSRKSNDTLVEVDIFDVVRETWRQFESRGRLPGQGGGEGGLKFY